MTDKELRKLNRAELLEMLLELSRENDRLRSQLAQAGEQLTQRQLMLDEAGSLAEASLRVNGVFQAAQQAADQYLENIRTLNDRHESICARREEESRRESERLLEETKARCQELESQTRERCAAMTREAEDRANSVWEETRQKLEQFIDQQAGLRELLRVVSGGAKQE